MLGTGARAIYEGPAARRQRVTKTHEDHLSNPDTSSTAGERRVRVSRVLAMVGLLAVAGGLLYVVTGGDGSAPPPPVPEGTKDVTAEFEQIQGNVKTRAVGGLDWKTAVNTVPLRRSDLVRTYPASSAEIKFFDETRVSVRPDSLITIEETTQPSGNAKGRVSWRVSSGEINYETKDNRGGLAEAVTPTFRLALEGNSAGTMRVSESGLTSVAQLAGVANIETKTGQKIRLAANEGLRVDATGKAGPKQVLPDAPILNGPTNGTVSLPEGAPFSLSWSAATGAYAYRVVAELAGAVVFDRDSVRGTAVQIPAVTRGDFTFRVAGLTEDGVSGRFSKSMKVTVTRTAAPVVRAAPAPVLVIEAFEARSNVLRIAGKTDPGARLTVNGDPVAVRPDGSFREFVTLARRDTGQRVVIRATSPAGGVTEEARTLPSGQ